MQYVIAVTKGENVGHHKFGLETPDGLDSLELLIRL